MMCDERKQCFISESSSPIKITTPNDGRLYRVSDGMGGRKYTSHEELSPNGEAEEIAQLKLELAAASDRFWREASFLNNRISDVEEKAKELSINKYHLERAAELTAEVCDELIEKVGVLEAQLAAKIDKPSASPELEAAEAYMDDYMKVRRRFSRERWLQKKRIERKLCRLKKAAEDKPEGSSRKKLYGAFCILGAIVIGILIL